MKQLNALRQSAIARNWRPIPQLSEVTVKQLDDMQTPEVLGFRAPASPAYSDDRRLYPR